MVEGTATIFQKVDSGYVRVSTNVQKTDGTRAIDTYIPNHSPVIQSIEKGEIYYGRAFVVNSWYITAYEPIVVNNKIVGILYVGDKEKDLEKLKETLYSLKIMESGYTFVFDKKGKMLIHPFIEGQNWADSSLFRQVQTSTKNIINYTYLGDKKTASFKYYDKFELYIVATIVIEKETKSFINRVIRTSTIVAILTIILVLLLLYFLTADRIYNYFIKLRTSEEKLHTTKTELKQLEDKFQKLFNSSGDDIFVTDIDENIIEVNQASCNTLGYTREELLNKKISEIKSEKYKGSIAKNREKIYKDSAYTFETEHITKNGKIIQVEMIARLVDYNNEKLILSVARNISNRKEVEREILSTVIRTEERERERFAKDMHDSVGPLLSTIKLYVNELKSPNLVSEERNEFVNTSNEIIDEAINSIRTISNNLMPVLINQFGLITAVESFCEKVNKTNKINVKFIKENIDKRFDKNLELIVFRVFTELINNSLKHAKAKNIIFKIEKHSNNVKISFQDDGIGFNINEIMKSNHKGMGLKNIISRIKSINGTYNFVSTPNNGFSINVNIDL